jgi:hypothetical protein
MADDDKSKKSSWDLRPQSVPSWLSDFSDHSPSNVDSVRHPPVAKLPARGGLDIQPRMENETDILLRPRAPISARTENLGSTRPPNAPKGPRGGRRRRQFEETQTREPVKVSAQGNDALEELWENLRIATTMGPGRDLDSLDGEDWQKDASTVR